MFFQLESIVFRNKCTSPLKFSLCSKLLNFLDLNKIFYTIFLVSLAESLSLCQNPLYCIQYYEISQRSEQKTKHKFYKSKYISLYLCLCVRLCLCHYTIQFEAIFAALSMLVLKLVLHVEDCSLPIFSTACRQLVSCPTRLFPR